MNICSMPQKYSYTKKTDSQLQHKGIEGGWDGAMGRRVGRYDIYDQWNNLVQRGSKTKGSIRNGASIIPSCLEVCVRTCERDWRKPVKRKERASKKKEYNYTVCGPICFPLKVVMQSVSFLIPEREKKETITSLPRNWRTYTFSFPPSWRLCFFSLMRISFLMNTDTSTMVFDTAVQAGLNSLNIPEVGLVGRQTQIQWERQKWWRYEISNKRFMWSALWDNVLCNIVLKFSNK